MKNNPSPPVPSEPHRRSRIRRSAIWAGVLLLVAGIPTLTFLIRLNLLIDGRLRQGALGESFSIYAAPHILAVGERLSAVQVVAELKQAGYSESDHDPAGHYRLGADFVEIHPGSASYFRPEGARVFFRDGAVNRIVLLNGNNDTQRYSMEPQLLFDLASKRRQKSRFVRFDEIPRFLVQAAVSAEDKHFFQHPGFDALRIVKAAYVNAKSGRRGQGGSTLTMQLARSLMLDGSKNWKRKLTESLIAVMLEQKLSKEQIFESYANAIYLGEYETYSIHGFAEAARIYFNKELTDITLPEAALLAAIVQRPNYFNPVKYPDRVLARRNATLSLMRQNGYITEEQERRAASAPSGISPVPSEDGDAPYYLGLAAEEARNLVRTASKRDSSYRVYTTLEPNLQRAAALAATAGLRQVDAALRKRDTATVVPQVALVALDAHTGEVRAVIGGRDFRNSQLNRAVAKRQPGSVFKPFVYATALSEADQGYRFTASSMVNDVPTAFFFEGSAYEPGNFGDHFYGRVSLRRALAKSMNVATVSIAERVGYKRVVELAKQAGLNDGIRPTPAVALGSYEVTPLEMAGAYTVFANEGTYVKPGFVAEIRTGAGEVVFRRRPEQRAVLDPRVAFVMRTLLEEVVQRGTGAAVRSASLTFPVAGKTGTSRDGWFAGFSSNLICVVWVGIDENTELNLEASKSALPIWTEFMKRAAENPYYAEPFSRPPEGIVTAEIDPETGSLATPECPASRMEYFVQGSEPRECDEHGEGVTIESVSDTDS